MADADLARHIATLVPAGAAASAGDLVALVDELTEAAARSCVELAPEAPLGVARRRDGRPVAEHVTDRHLSTAAILDQETQLLAWATAAADPVPADTPDPAETVADAVAGHGDLVLVVGRDHVWQAKWVAARRALDLPGLHFHDLRHVANTLTAATGASTRELMHRMGHASPAAALRYQHATRDRDAAIAAAVGRLIARPDATVTPLHADAEGT
ncbi:MAG: hypothetical protein ACRDZW_07210 [Acidimicrobiales bacterium]